MPLEVYEEYRRLEDNKKTSAKEWRKFHRYAKHFGYRTPMAKRYPNLPLVISIISLLLVLLKLILIGMHL